MLKCDDNGFIHRAPVLPDGKPSLQQSPKLNTPVLRAHVDFSAKSGPRRLKDIMKDEAERLGKTPYGILQVSGQLGTSLSHF